MWILKHRPELNRHSFLVQQGWQRECTLFHSVLKSVLTDSSASQFTTQHFREWLFSLKKKASELTRMSSCGIFLGLSQCAWGFLFILAWFLGKPLTGPSLPASHLPGSGPPGCPGHMLPDRWWGWTCACTQVFGSPLLIRGGHCGAALKWTSCD